MNLIADISSIITIITFIIYIVGKLIMINKNYWIKYEDFIQIYNDSEEKLVIHSTKAINWIKICKIIYDNNLNVIGYEEVPLIKYKKLSPNETIELNYNQSELVPIYRVFFERYDYIQVSFNLEFNGLNGGIVRGDENRKITLKSYLYYLFL